MDNLSISHKEALKYLVGLIREQIITEEFYIHWSVEGPFIPAEGGFVKGPEITQIGLRVLEEAGFMLCSINNETRESEFGGAKSITISERSRLCTITPLGYRAVDSNFSMIHSKTNFLPLPRSREVLSDSAKIIPTLRELRS